MEPLLRDAADTARWVAVYRAHETDRSDSLFRDPWARRLAGSRGELIADHMRFATRHSWSWAIRTYLFDQFILEQIQHGVDMVVNLAGGLDARPYRMALPSALRWVEVDLPGILSEKERILKGEKANCLLERIGLDLSNASARRQLFARLGRESEKALILTEGFTVYLAPGEVASLARDLAAAVSFRKWVLDLSSPGVLLLLQTQIGAHLGRAGLSLRFAPREGPEFFLRYGWRPADVRSLLQTAARLNRLSLGLRLLAMLPQSSRSYGLRPWSGVCMLVRR
jgi:methyltransferase (TIGR00027 family)